ncbi:hypothetical protein OF83DRAFT_1088892 [Amylostereum chailletii]|nr:hypothetical protein OF83DRAFT_1088892 [Amylostereum chailletii]
MVGGANGSSRGCWQWREGTTAVVGGMLVVVVRDAGGGGGEGHWQWREETTALTDSADGGSGRRRWRRYGTAAAVGDNSGGRGRRQLWEGTLMVADECKETAATCSDGGDGASNKKWRREGKKWRRGEERRVDGGGRIRPSDQILMSSGKLMPVARPGQVASGFANSAGLDN